MRLSDSELVSICENEIENASGYVSGELARDRAAAMDYYLGEPYGNEEEGRSQIVTREVLDTIESIMPQMMRIFADADNLVEFDAVGPEDEDAAQQESDRVNHAFWKENRGFYNLYTFTKDALLSKTGNLKCWWKEGEEPEREEYENLTDEELGELIGDDTVEREVIEYEQKEDGSHHVVFLTTREAGRVCVEPVTPEEFGINSDARSPYAQDATFCYHRVRKNYGELLAEGYDKAVLDRIPSNDDVETEERLARRNLTDEYDSLADRHSRMRVYWITECYVRIDRDDDGVAELLKVTIATGAYTSASGAELLDVEEIDAMPFFTASPILMTHKFYGLSVADLVMELQRIKSTLMRQVLDNTYLLNNEETAINERANPDDFMVSRPGGIKRIEGQDPVQGSVMSLPKQPLPPHTFDLFGYLDEERKDRTGSADQVPGLDATSLANVNTGVAAIAYDQARMRVELIARILAEVGLRPLLCRVHELLQKNQKKAEMVKLRGKWVNVNPAEWRTRKNVTVMVGLGIASRERRLVALDTVMTNQRGIIEAGGMGTLIEPRHIYQVMHDHAEALGLEPSLYFLDPREAQPKQPEGPSIQDQAMMAQAQAQLGAAEAQKQRNQVELFKAQSNERLAMAKYQAEQMAAESRRQLEQLEWQQQSAHRQLEAASAIEKDRIAAEIKERDQQIKAAELRMRDQQEAAKREAEMLRAIIQSGTTLTQEQMRLAGADEGGASGLFSDLQAQTAEMVQQAIAGVADAVAREFGEVKAQLIEQREAARKPREIKRDANGLMIAIGDMPVTRDGSGNVVRIG